VRVIWHHVSYLFVVLTGFRYSEDCPDRDLQSVCGGSLSVGGSSVNKLCLAAVLAWSGSAYAVLPGAPPRPMDDPSLGTMRFCQTFSVRAAWGAEARFKGAPSAFRYVARDLVREYFMSDNPPPDGIYVAEDLDLNERLAYEEVAFFGWQHMDGWLRADPQRSEPDWAAMPAVFYKMCKDAHDDSVGGAIVR
jgi:hypothetical protein